MKKGQKCPEDTCIKISNKMKGRAPTKGNTGRKLSDDIRKKMSIAHQGYKASDETRAKMSISQLGNTKAKGYKHTEETKKKISIAHQGMRHTEETKKKVSIARKGHKFSDEHRRKISINYVGMTGKKHSAETRAKISAKRCANLSYGANPKFKHGYYDSIKAGRIYFRSSYELRMYKILDIDDSVKSYEVEAFAIEYEYNGIIHLYTPDLYVKYKDKSRKHIEIKAKYLITNAKNQAKFKAAIEVFGDRFVIITEDELSEYEKLCTTTV